MDTIVKRNHRSISRDLEYPKLTIGHITVLQSAIQKYRSEITFTLTLTFLLLTLLLSYKNEMLFFNELLITSTIIATLHTFKLVSEKGIS